MGECREEKGGDTVRGRCLTSGSDEQKDYGLYIYSLILISQCQTLYLCMLYIVMPAVVTWLHLSVFALMTPEVEGSR
jgi:hypothetical protein